MHKEEIIEMFERLHRELNAFVSNLSKEQKSTDIAGKWSVLQNLDHLNKVLALLNKAMAKPKFILRFAFGKPNRLGRTYKKLEARYHEKAQGPAVAPEVYRAEENASLSTEAVEEEFQVLSQKFLRIVEKKWSDKQLDKYLLVHPLLGRLTIREMLYFVHWHTNHHFSAMKSLRIKL
jgi:uncharacterized damage-inducible protein DinB